MAPLSAASSPAAAGHDVCVRAGMADPGPAAPGPDDFLHKAAGVGSFTVAGRRLPAGDPTRFVTGTLEICAASPGTVTLANVGGWDGKDIYYVTACGIEELCVRDTLNAADNYAWCAGQAHPLQWPVGDPPVHAVN